MAKNNFSCTSNNNKEIENIFNLNIHKYDVIIIGSGIAGCEAARKLYDTGIKNILVLEARERLGGRIQTIHLNDDVNMPIEWGANWIHGVVNNPLYNLVKENPKIFYHDKEDLFSEEVVQCVDETGKHYSPELCYEMYDLYRKLLNSAKLYAENRKHKCPYKSYEEYIKKMLDLHTRNDDEDLRQVKQAILRRLLKQEQTEHGCSTMKECSLNDYGHYLKLPGPDYEFPGGFSKLINYLVEPIPTDCFKFNHVVETIKPINDDLNEVQVTCFNGEIFQARHVILTCPLNYLKRHHTTMLPNLLTDRKINAINSMKMGTCDKIFLVYDECDGGMDFFPKNINALHPIFIKDDHQDYDVFKWFKKTFTFDKFYDNVLLVWTTGDEAVFVESIDEDTIAKELTKLLRNLLQNNDIPLPSKVIRTKWNSDPYALGSYTYMHVDCDLKPTIEALAEPVYINGVPRILFAGEATHPKFFSTVHGAYLSGQREAKRLLQLYHSRVSLEG